MNGYTEKMKMLIADSEMRKRCGAAGKQFIQENFSKEIEVERTKDFYFSLLNQKGISLIPKG